MMKRRSHPLLLSLALLAPMTFLSCGQEKKADAPPAKEEAAGKKSAHPALKDPSKAAEKAPETFKALLSTTEGDIEITVTRKWSPLGADRFYNLVKIGYFSDIAFFRNIGGFMAQFGIHGDPAVNTTWKNANIKDDPSGGISNTLGKVSFAKTGAPNSRSVQFFINHGNNKTLDGMGFTPFGEVTKGMDVVKKLYSGYGEGAPRGQGPDQGKVQAQGNAYLKAKFPELDYIKSAKIVK